MMDELEVTSWEWEDVPVYDRHGNIRYYQKTRVPREYKHVPFELPEPTEDDYIPPFDEWIEF